MPGMWQLADHRLAVD